MLNGVFKGAVIFVGDIKTLVIENQLNISLSARRSEAPIDSIRCLVRLIFSLFFLFYAVYEYHSSKLELMNRTCDISEPQPICKLGLEFVTAGVYDYF